VLCRLLLVDEAVVRVRGQDAFDGTPILDIKPYLTGFAPRGEVVEPQWAKEITSEYWTRWLLAGLTFVHCPNQGAPGMTRAKLIRAMRVGG
jgi:hypothetical protein